MGEARLPPWYVNVSTWLLYQVDLPSSVRVTGMRILGLGWNHDYEYTDPVPLARLCAWCGLSRARIYGHLRQLRLAGVLRYTALAGVLVFDLRPARVHSQPARAGPSLNIETRDALVVVDDSSADSEDSLILEKDQQQQQVIPVLGGECEGGAEASLKNETGASAEIRTGESGNPDWEARLEVLDEMGVMEPTRSQVAGLEYATVEFLEGWADWLLTQDAVGVGFVVWSMRAGQEAPWLSRERMARREIQEWEAEVMGR